MCGIPENLTGGEHVNREAPIETPQQIEAQRQIETFGTATAFQVQEQIQEHEGPVSRNLGTVPQQDEELSLERIRQNRNHTKKLIDQARRNVAIARSVVTVSQVPAPVEVYKDDRKLLSRLFTSSDKEKADAIKAQRARAATSFRDRETGEISSVANHVTYDLMADLTEQNVQKNNSIGSETLARVARANMDTRFLMAFLQGYKKGANGEPATPEDEAQMLADKAFVDDYISPDLTKRKPYLDRMVEMFLNARYNKDMFTADNLQKNGAVLWDMAQKLTYFENVYKDPKNAQYFNSLPGATQDLLRTKLDPNLNVASLFSGLLVSEFQAIGVEPNSATYCPPSLYDNKKSRKEATEMHSFLRDNFNEKLGIERQRVNEVLARHQEKLAEHTLNLQETQWAEGSIQALEFNEMVEAFPFPPTFPCPVL